MSVVNHSRAVSVTRGGDVMASGGSGANQHELINTPDYSHVDLSHTFKTTGQIGPIMPCGSLQLNRGDKLDISGDFTQRFQPLLSPAMTNIETHVHTFFSKMKYLDYGWEQFNTKGVKGTYTRPLFHIDLMKDGYTPAGGTHNNHMYNENIGHSDHSSYHGFTLCGVHSLYREFDYPMIYNEVTFPDDSPKEFRPCGQFTPHRLIAYSRVYNDYYRVPQLELDEWTDQSEATNLNKIGHKILDIIDTHDNLDDFLSILRSPSTMPAGWMDIVLHYLTDPHFFEITKSINFNYYDPVANIFEMPVIFNWNTGAISSNSEATAMAVEDWAIYAWVINLMIGRCAPWQRHRSMLALPNLQRGTFNRLTLPVLSPSVVAASNIKADQSNKVTSLDNTIVSLGYQVSAVNGSNKLRCSLSYNDLRTMSAFTRFLEKSSRIGYRYDEWLKGFFGLEDNTAETCKPHYIGGMKDSASINKVTSTADTETANIGDFTGEAITGTNTGKLNLDCPDTGVFIALYYTRPTLSYALGFDRNNCKFADETAFYMPDFANLQEQPVFACEFEGISASSTINDIIGFLNGDSPNSSFNSGVLLGYEQRYSEYKQHLNHIGGELVTSQPYWHTAHLMRHDVVPNSPDWHHCCPDDYGVNRIFQYNQSEADSFTISFNWNIKGATLVEHDTEPTNNI